jgi:regulator of sigma E protease
MLTAIVFFLVLSVLILIHEFGHFYVAKKSGMLVEEFGLGLPPRLFGKKIGETLYSFNLLPFGGFVKIFGESPEDLKNHPDPKLAKRSFANKPWYQRAGVIVAGPTMNFVLAVLVISYMFTKGTYLPSGKVQIVEVNRGSPAALAGLKKDDILRQFGAQKLGQSSDLIGVAKKFAGQKVKVLIEREGKLFTRKLTPRKNPPKNEGALGVTISDLELKKYPFWQAPWVGLQESVRISLMFYGEMGKILGKLLLFQNPQVEVAGPVGIARLTGQAVNVGFDAVIQLLGLLSLNLALINIIPFPALDGGQLTFILYETVFRRRIKEEVKAKINTFGFAFLMLLIVLITIKDITGLI